MKSSLALLPSVRFHISLNVSNLERSARFYEILLNSPPSKKRDDYAKFEINDPPIVLSLHPTTVSGSGALNHVGFRLPDARQLVAAQERLERAGIRSQREEGVECCYARQTKFWVHDPDNTLWEFYTLDDDTLPHHGAGQSLEVMMSSTLPEDAVIYEHRLGSEIPIRIEACDDTHDEVRLRGSFNTPVEAETQDALLKEVRRILKPNGRVLLRMLSGDRTHESPNLPGSGAYVKFVPAKDDLMSAVTRAGFAGIRLLKYDDPPCFTQDGVIMRETHIEAFKQ